MPNTIVHIGLQAVATRAVIRGADLKWIYLGAMLPDLPWILRRAERVFLPNIPAYDASLYAIVQSTWALCLVLSTALACFSVRWRGVFAVLALGSFVHLLLDSLQKKLGNGVHLFAPFSWDLLNFGLFWPEDLPTILMTLFGAGFYIYAWRKFDANADDLRWPKGRRLMVAVFALLVYFLAPLALLSSPEAADNLSIKTLRETENRPGRMVTFDRARYSQRPEGDILYTFAGEPLAVEGPSAGRSGTASVRARFIDARKVQILEIHWHWRFARDMAASIGLALILLYWGRALRARLRSGWPGDSGFRSSS
jgi:hypothetical protein